MGGEQPISILDLSGIPASVLTDLVGILLRVIYDALFWGRDLMEGGRERPLLLVLEEAHAYLSQGDEGPAAKAVRRIVKEGRKYGIGAMIVSLARTVFRRRKFTPTTVAPLRGLRKPAVTLAESPVPWHRLRG